MLTIMFLTVTLTSDTPTEGVCFMVPITSDSQQESDEYFRKSLNENPLVNLSPFNNQTNITILNDDCEALSSPFGGQVILNGTAAGSIATYVCDPDSELIGNATRVCQIDGTWSGEEPLCQGELLLYIFIFRVTHAQSQAIIIPNVKAITMYIPVSCTFKIDSMFTYTGILYPFGDEAGDLRSRRSDDGGTGPISLVYGPLLYFGTNYSSIYVRK